jgi:hypothetical protein
VTKGSQSLRRAHSLFRCINKKADFLDTLSMDKPIQHITHECTIDGWPLMSDCKFHHIGFQSSRHLFPFFSVPEKKNLKRENDEVI